MTRTSRIAVSLALVALAAGGSVLVARSEPPRPAGSEPPAVPQGQIAYMSIKGGSEEQVWVVNSDGTGDRELAPEVPDEHLHPAWLPDGRRLVFTKRAEKDVLFEADGEGRGARRLLACADPCIGDDEAAFSPDGRRIALIRFLGPLGGPNEVPRDCALWIVDRTTGKAKRVTRHRDCVSRETFPRWSPDGRSLLYYRERSDADNVTYASAVFVRSLRTGKERRLTPWKLDAGDPDWSPDGRRIVFTTAPLTYFDEGRSNLYTIRPDGSDRRRLTDNPNGGNRSSQPRYTPDGRHIVHVLDTGSSRDIALMRPDGSGFVRLSDGGIWTHPAWRPGSGG